MAGRFKKKQVIKKVIQRKLCGLFPKQNSLLHYKTNHI